MQKAEVAHLHEASGQDVLEEPAYTLEDVEAGGARAGTARFAGGEGDGALLEADDAAVGDSDFEDLRREVCEGGVTVWVGLTRHIPGRCPDLRRDLFKLASFAHLLCEDGAVEG
jgi:hypothetical protein